MAISKRLVEGPSFVMVCCVLLLMSACDTMEEDEGTIILGETVEFEFRFETDGGTVEAVSTGAEDLSDELGRIGFSKSEILRAGMVGATLRRVQPVGRSLSELIEGATLQLQAANGTPVTVTQPLSTVPDDNEAPLTPEPGRDIATILKASSFRGVLVLDGVEADPNYVLEVSIELRMEVEGP